jgi:hypothetical protein
MQKGRANRIVCLLEDIQLPKNAKYQPDRADPPPAKCQALIEFE